LSAHLSSLNLEKQDGDAAESSGIPASLTVSDCNETPVKDADIPIGLSLKDSLAAVCNATQAAARIHQVFRVQSFQKKQLKEYGDDKFGMSHERALSLIAVKSQKAGQYDEPVHAAIRIQNKFRGWKGRKEFLIIRQRIVKIQVHLLLLPPLFYSFYFLILDFFVQLTLSYKLFPCMKHRTLEN